MYALLTFTVLLASAQAFIFGLQSLFGGGCNPCAQQGYAAQAPAYQAPAYQAPAYQAYSSYQAPAPAYQAPVYPSYSQQASYGPSGGYAQAPQAYGNAQQYQSFSAPQQAYRPSYGPAAAPQGYQQQAPQHFEAIPESPLPEPVPQQPIVSEGYVQPAASVYQAPARPTYTSQVSETAVAPPPPPPPAPSSYEQPAPVVAQKVTEVVAPAQTYSRPAPVASEASGY